mmetsp:Transcript_12144/g.33657  ORF Transcript_12144/g.33657 Transcript_12144/m.33657 type:complete len:454 (+) Transcript_12144:402-1763(+)
MKAFEVGKHVSEATGDATHDKRRHQEDIGDQIIRDNRRPPTLLKQFRSHLACFHETVAMKTDIRKSPWVESSCQSFNTRGNTGSEALEAFVQAQQRGIIRGTEENRNLSNDANWADEKASKTDGSHGVEDGLEGRFLDSVFTVRLGPPASNYSRRGYLDKIQKNLVGPVEGNCQGDVGENGPSSGQYNAAVLNTIIHSNNNHAVVNTPGAAQELEKERDQDCSRKGPNRRQGCDKIGSRKWDTIPNNNRIGNRKSQSYNASDGNNVLWRQANPYRSPNKAESNHHHQCNLYKFSSKKAHNAQQQRGKRNSKHARETSHQQQVLVVNGDRIFHGIMIGKGFGRIGGEQKGHAQQVKDKNQQKHHVAAHDGLILALDGFHIKLSRLLTHVTPTRGLGGTGAFLTSQKDGFPTAAADRAGGQRIFLLITARRGQHGRGHHHIVTRTHGSRCIHHVG